MDLLKLQDVQIYTEPYLILHEVSKASGFMQSQLVSSLLVAIMTILITLFVQGMAYYFKQKAIKKEILRNAKNYTTKLIAVIENNLVIYSKYLEYMKKDIQELSSLEYGIFKTSQDTYDIELNKFNEVQANNLSLQSHSTKPFFDSHYKICTPYIIKAERFIKSKDEVHTLMMFTNEYHADELYSKIQVYLDRKKDKDFHQIHKNLSEIFSCTQSFMSRMEELKESLDSILNKIEHQS